jgi:hypothetical protein
MEYNLNFIALTETRRSDLGPRFLKKAMCGKRLSMVFQRSSRSGGMLLGINLQCYDIGGIDEGEFYIKFYLCNKMDGLKWAWASVYGPAQNEHNEGF